MVQTMVGCISNNTLTQLEQPPCCASILNFHIKPIDLGHQTTCGMISVVEYKIVSYLTRTGSHGKIALNHYGTPMTYK